MFRYTSIMLAAACCMFAANIANGAELRTTDHDKYGRELWTYVNGSNPWSNWTPALVGLKPAYGPQLTPNSRAVVNAQGWTNPHGYGALIAARHFDQSGAKGKPVSVTIWYRVKKGYDAKSNDWYWAHYLANGTLVATSVDKNPLARRGFITVRREDRLWVFSATAPELGQFLTKGELATSVDRAKAGPDGITLVAPDNATIDAYLAEKPLE